MGEPPEKNSTKQILSKEFSAAAADEQRAKVYSMNSTREKYQPIYCGWEKAAKPTPVCLGLLIHIN
jgi:hypothetical protein